MLALQRKSAPTATREILQGPAVNLEFGIIKIDQTLEQAGKMLSKDPCNSIESFLEPIGGITFNPGAKRSQEHPFYADVHVGEIGLPNQNRTGVAVKSVGGVSLNDDVNYCSNELSTKDLSILLAGKRGILNNILILRGIIISSDDHLIAPLIEEVLVQGNTLRDLLKTDGFNRTQARNELRTIIDAWNMAGYCVWDPNNDNIFRTDGLGWRIVDAGSLVKTESIPEDDRSQIMRNPEYLLDSWFNS